MTDHSTLLGLLGQWVTVTHPSAPERVWHGQLASLMDCPSIVLQMPEGGTEVLPQAFDVAGAAPAGDGPHPDVDSRARSFAELRDSGLLWLINRTALHPRGLALALHLDEHGQAYGWSLVSNAEGEPWQFDPATDNDGYQRAEATITKALDREPDATRCIVCGGGPVVYENFKDQPFCAGCANCDCGQDICARSRQARCTATGHDAFHGRAHCALAAGHYTSDYDTHEGQTEDGSLLRWRDGDRGSTPHGPDTARPHPDPDEPPAQGVRVEYQARVPRHLAPLALAEGLKAVADARAAHDTARTPHPDGTSGRPDARPDTGPQPSGRSRPPVLGSTSTSTDTVRTTHPDATSGRPDADADGFMPRAGLRAAVAELMDLPPDLLGDSRCTCGQDSPLVYVDPDGGHFHMDPADHEKLMQGRDDVSAAAAAWGQCWDRAENLRTRLALARQVLVDDGYFTDEEIGDDLAPRLVEWASVHRDRIRELAAALTEALAEFTVPAQMNGTPSLRTGYVEARTVERWRNTLAHVRSLPTPDAKPRVQGRCPTCGSETLHLGDGGHITCARLECPDRHAAGDLLGDPPNPGYECRRDQCDATRRDLITAATAYETLRTNAITAAKYIAQQQAAGFPLRGGDNRHRILATLNLYAGDPGQLKLTSLKEHACR
ncbi:hypothetical protein DI272_19080 [Streptomyces sp. Act143]|nr:hypothetical protein DI272_19080 [Streptomyces sp. Act143]